MKFVVLFIALACALPLSILLRSSPKLVPPFWVLFGTLPFLATAIPMFDIGLVTWSGTWIGFVYSLEVTLIDILAVAALLSLDKERIPFWCKLPLLLYIATTVLSIFVAREPMAASFGALQIARMYLVMVVVARACLEPGIAIYILRGMALGLAAHLVAVLYQRLGLGLTQAHGLFLHQNTLGMTAHLVLLPYLALLLHGYRGTWIQLLTVLAALLVVVFTASRAAVGFSALGIALVFVILALAGMTQRKLLFALSGVLVVAVIAPLAVSSFERRFQEVPLSEEQYDERAAFNRAASYIVEDNPFGVGSNHYVYVAKNYGYSQRAGVAPNEGNRNNIVHNAYWLAAAETGYPGVVAFCLMLLVPMVTAFRNGWRERANASGALLLGFGVALLTVYLHSMFEWIIFAKEVQYVLVMTMGMVFGISTRIAAERSAGATEPAATSADTIESSAVPAVGRRGMEGAW